MLQQRLTTSRHWHWKPFTTLRSGKPIVFGLFVCFVLFLVFQICSSSFCLHHSIHWTEPHYSVVFSLGPDVKSLEDLLFMFCSYKHAKTQRRKEQVNKQVNGIIWASEFLFIAWYWPLTGILIFFVRWLLDKVILAVLIWNSNFVFTP